MYRFLQIIMKNEKMVASIIFNIAWENNVKFKQVLTIIRVNISKMKMQDSNLHIANFIA
jgi:hypothetical protein